MTDNITGNTVIDVTNAVSHTTVLELALALLRRFDPAARVKVLSFAPYSGEPEYSNPHPRQFDHGDVTL